jgi:hypothetical protein
MVEAELWRLRGEVLLKSTGTAASSEAEASFLRAIGIARNQGARPWELRAATSHARLLDGTARREQGRETLRSVLDVFDEAADTPDLRDARALLLD